MSEPTNTLVIGVLTQDLSFGIKEKFGEKEYICSLGTSYVKFIEDCGGKCLPIAHNQSIEYYQHIVSIVHAVILPGGSFYVSESKGYTPSGILLLDAVTSAADRGRVIPVYGVCLGFELMAVYFGSPKYVVADILTEYRPIVCGWKALDIHEVSPKLIPLQQFEELKKNNLVNFRHRACVPLKTFNANARLKEEWQVLATNDLKTTEIYHNFGDKKKLLSTGETLTAVTMVESKSRPYVGVQFHPEKALHFSTQRKQCPDIAKAEAASKLFISFLTGLIKKYNTSLTFPVEEHERLIDRFKPEDVRAANTIAFDYVYMFRDGDLVTSVSPNLSQ